MPSRPEVSGRKAGEAVAPLAFTIPEFCRAHRISESFYYKLRPLGLGPQEKRVLDKVLITHEAAARWRARRERAEQSA
jgi:hypothetical protein